MSTANSARNRKAVVPEKKGLILFPGDHPYAEEVNTAIPTNPEVYGNNPDAQYAIGRDIGKRAASLYLSAGGKLVYRYGGWLSQIVLNAAESLPEYVARGFIVGFLANIEKLIPVDPQCIEAQVRGIQGLTREVELKMRMRILESYVTGTEKFKEVLKMFDDTLDNYAVGD